MAKKSSTFGVIIHAPDGMDNAWLQQRFDDFYIQQVKKRLNDSGLDREAKVEILDRLIARHAQTETASSQS